MPWQETNAVDQRLRFIADLLREEMPFAALCRQYGISRETGYKWRGRYLEEGAEGLYDRSRAPASHPNATPPKVVELLLEARRVHPRWGPRKLRAVVARDYPGLELPSASTIGELLRREGLTVPRRRRNRTVALASHLGSQDGPNSTWAIDFKGQFRTRDGRYCYPLTLQDGFSRYLLRCQALPRTSADGVRPVLDAAFREFGLPVAIRSDNGSPFAGAGFTGLSVLSTWWVKLGIRLDRSRPGKPQDNGRLERLHRTLLDEDACEPQSNLSSQQAHLVNYRRVFNEVRPHEALQMRTPAELYAPSDRPYDPAPVPVYDGMTVRPVNATGSLYFAGWTIRLTDLLAGEDVGVLEVEDGVLELRFYAHVLGRFDLRTGILSNGENTRKCTHYSYKPSCPVRTRTNRRRYPLPPERP